MEILQQPAALNFSGNLPDLIVSDTDPVTFKLYRGADLLLEEIYQPDSADQIRIILKDVIEGLLAIVVPDFGEETYHQEAGYDDFSFELNEEDAIEFRVVKGGVGVEDPLDTDSFLSSNFLTWQPQQKKVLYHDPEWLTYYAASVVSLKAKGFFAEGDETIELAELPAAQLTSINLNYGRLIELFEEQPLYIDVWVELDEERLTFIQRYILSTEEFQYNDIFVLENSLGGLDTIRFTGELQDNNDFEFESALFDEETRDYYSNPAPDFEKNTGAFRTTRERTWSLEFFKSLQKYYLHEGILKRIRVTKNSLSGVKGLLNSYNFNFTWAKQNKYLNLSRADVLPEDLSLEIGDQVAILPPRVNEFPIANFSNILFAVQPAYTAEWRRLSLFDLLKLLGVALETEAGVTKFLTGSFTVINSSETYSYDIDDDFVLVTDLRLKGREDFPVYSTQNNTEFRKEQLEYDPIVGTVKILNFQLNDTEHITIHPGGLQEVPDSGLSYPELVGRIEKLEMYAAPFIPQGDGNGGGGMVLFKRAAMYIPAGWIEVEDWRDRLPKGWSGNDIDGIVGSAGGSDTHTLTEAQLPAHNFKLFSDDIRAGAPSTEIIEEDRFVARGATNKGPVDYELSWSDEEPTLGKSSTIGSSEPFSLESKYRIVMFIECKPEP